MRSIRQLRDLLLTDDEHHKNELIVPTGQDIYRVLTKVIVFLMRADLTFYSIIL